MFQRFKRVALIALTTMILVIAVAASASAARVQATKNVNVRAKATTSSSVLTVMKKGVDRKVLAVSKSGNWIKVKMNGKTGYVHKSRIKCISGSLSEFNRTKLGEFKLTFYGGDSTTASGKTPQVNHTIAVDPRVIPLGSKVYIEGWGTYYAEDTGGAIKNNIIDIFVSSEAEANRIGVKYADVYLYN